jgi:hypothetical protein
MGGIVDIGQSTCDQNIFFCFADIDLLSFIESPNVLGVK